MKLIVQIPCFNEARTLPLLFERMPKAIDGIDCIEFLVLDDGSTDETAEVAVRLGVHHVVRVAGRNRRWLGRAFKMGADIALQLGADILVNTDGDNQYPSESIPLLVRPILDGRADIVIGDRRPGTFAEFTFAKRCLQRAGNWTIRFLTGESVPDAVSGFRAYSRTALLRLNVITNFTYTVDTLIQSYKKGLDVAWVEIAPNRKTRESRLISSSLEKVQRSGFNILRLLAVYDPFRVFLIAAALFFVPASLLLGRFCYFFLFDHAQAAGHIQSVIVGGALLVISAVFAVFSIIGGLLSVNRMLLEDILFRLKSEDAERSAERDAVPARMVVNRSRTGAK
ncbi:MAG: glycosyltransferase family 2 protein [Bdellovibrionota bacterium]